MNKWPILLVVLCLGLLGQERHPKLMGQVDQSRRVTLSITDHTVEFSVREPGPSGTATIRKKVVEARSLIISADEMKFNQDTGEIEPRGNVRVKIN